MENSLLLLSLLALFPERLQIWVQGLPDHWVHNQIYSSHHVGAKLSVPGGCESHTELTGCCHLSCWSRMLLWFLLRKLLHCITMGVERQEVVTLCHDGNRETGSCYTVSWWEWRDRKLKDWLLLDQFLTTNGKASPGDHLLRVEIPNLLTLLSLSIYLYNFLSYNEATSLEQGDIELRNVTANSSISIATLILVSVLSQNTFSKMPNVRTMVGCFRVFAVWAKDWFKNKKQKNPETFCLIQLSFKKWYS